MKLKKNMKIGMAVGAVALLAGGTVLSFSLFGKDKKEDPKNIPEEKRRVKIVDVTSNSRPYAVMINNVTGAREIQSGLQDAYLVYELTVEGGITRLEAFFKDKMPERLGSIRSSRPYYLDYVLENDAIYAHWGGSDEALENIKTLGIDNINGNVYEGKYFFRDKDLKDYKYEYTGITSMKSLQEAAKDLKYRTTTKQPLLLNYTANEVNLNELEGAKKADNISITNSASYISSYKYDAINKVYLRSVNGTPCEDYVTKKQHTVKNIITYQVQYTTVDSVNHQKMDNIGSGEGYYISNGYAVPIKWEKKSRSAQTSYKYLDGTPIDVNDGNTWIHIHQKGNELKIS